MQNEQLSLACLAAHILNNDHNCQDVEDTQFEMLVSPFRSTKIFIAGRTDSGRGQVLTVCALWMVLAVLNVHSF